jgi:hypothetical protein
VSSGTVACVRCGRVAELPAPGVVPPEGWEGTAAAAVCPGCQYVEWHPHCTSLRSDYGYGGRVDVEALARGESVTYQDQDGDTLIARSLHDVRGELAYCDYIDTSIAWTDDADFPASWTCPKCGGITFEGVHRDYMQSGLKGSFSADVEEDGTDG